MTRRIRIFDTTLRDGSQREGIAFSVEDKREVITALDSLGVDFVEAGMPQSNPKDAELFGSLPETKCEVVAFGSTCRPGMSPEEDRWVLDLAEHSGDWVCIFGKAWRMQAENVLHVNEEENLRMICDTTEFLRSRGKHVIFDAEHFFDGYREDRGFAMSAVRAAADAGAEWVCLCDTNGGSLPKDVHDAVADVCGCVSAGIGIHTHNDSDLAVACALAAVEAGAGMVQGTINGIGERCGNANLCSVIPDLMLKMGLETNADLSRLTTVSMTVAEIANTRQDPSMPYVGRRAFTHKGGMHIDALLKDTRAYEHIAPEIVGNRRVMVVSELSGKAGVSRKMDELGIPHTDEDVRKVLATVKEMESRGYQFEAADASLELLMRRVCQNLEPPFEIPAFRVYMDETSDGIKSEASIKVRDRNGSTEHTAADGDGPVDALSNALKKALSKFFPVMERMRLIDYKVRVLDEKAATAAPVRVIIRSTDGESQWSTVGVSTNVIEASLTALTDSVEYGIYINRE